MDITLSRIYYTIHWVGSSLPGDRQGDSIALAVLDWCYCLQWVPMQYHVLNSFFFLFCSPLSSGCHCIYSSYSAYQFYLPQDNLRTKYSCNNAGYKQLVSCVNWQQLLHLVRPKFMTGQKHKRNEHVMNLMDLGISLGKVNIIIITQ